MMVWNEFKKNRLGFAALLFLIFSFIIGLYAPFLASSKPFIVLFEGKLYFPFFRYLFFKGFYTKEIDLFYNVLMFTLPVALIGAFLIKKGRKTFLLIMVGVQVALFTLFSLGVVKDPESNPAKIIARQEVLKKRNSPSQDPLLGPPSTTPTWDFDLSYLNEYNKMGLILKARSRQLQEERLSPYGVHYAQKTGKMMPTLWRIEENNRRDEINALEKKIVDGKHDYERALQRVPELEKAYRPISLKNLMDKEGPKEENEEEIVTLLSQTKEVINSYREAKAKLAYLEERAQWLETEDKKLKVILSPFLRPFHWEEDAGGGQSFNAYLPWFELTRLNRKDLASSLLFGIRVSLIIGVTAVSLALLIGLPLGTYAGYFAGKTDILLSRFIEIWEAMPTFFMLLMVVAMTQSKSIFLVVATLGFFGWTSFARFMRGEVLKQRNLPYILACKSLGFSNSKIMVSHILPNAIPPILTLLPFAMMAAITSEAGLSFLGLGEEGSASLGVLMNEGRSVFPGESYLLWPPALVLTLLLVSIALVGDALRDAIDPKMRR